MLILTRRPGETIVIGREIQVHVVGVNGNQVRIGVTAPSAVAVDREEIYLRKRERNSRAKPISARADEPLSAIAERAGPARAGG